MTILLPQKFELNQQLWNLIQLYYQKHQFKENKIKIKKVSIYPIRSPFKDMKNL